MSRVCPGPLRIAAFLRLALCSASGLNGLAVRGELKLGFLECCRPFITDVWRWCLFEVRRCRPVSSAIDEVAASSSGITGCAEGALEDEPIACDKFGPWRFLPLVTE